MIGFSESIKRAADLAFGDRVQWWGETFRVVTSVSPIGDGSGHLRVAYANETSTRYAAGGLVRCLELAPIPVPVTA